MKKAQTWVALAVLTLAFAALVGTTATPAHAHDYLVDSTPAANSVVTELPDAFTVTTNEQLLDLTGVASGFALQVVDSSGNYYGDGCLSVSGSTLSSGASLGLSGDYTLIWQVVSDDGHPVSGELTFTWQPTDATQTSNGSVTPPVCGEGAPTPTATASAGSATQSPSTAVPLAVAPTSPVDPGTVWLVAGTIAALLGAALLTVLVLGIRSRRNPPPTPL